jgi:hypothetical protein
LPGALAYRVEAGTSDDMATLIRPGDTIDGFPIETARTLGQPKTYRVRTTADCDPGSRW